MKTFTSKSKADTRQPGHNPRPRQAVPAKMAWINNRPEAIAQRKLQGAMNQSSRAQALAQLQHTIHNSPRLVAQRGQLARMFGHSASEILTPASTPPVVQRFQLRKWHVTEQLDLVKLLGGDGPWDTDSLSPETKRQLYALLSRDGKFSIRSADLEQLKKSFEPADQPSEALRPLPTPAFSVTAPEAAPTALTTPDLLPKPQIGLREVGRDVPHDVRVARAMAAIPRGTETSEATVMTALINEYGSAQALVEPSKTPAFASALLESIRSRQSAGWASATAMVKPDSRTGLPGKIEDWTIRHYTNKATVTLGDPGDHGLRKVVAVDTPPFNELLSMVTLTAMRMHGLGNYPLNLSPKQKLHTNSSSKTSGHTSALDWKHIGNVGDTFYALFYKGKSATGVVPAFITDALYYAEWKISEFGDAWASSDWLSTAAGSKDETAKRPSGRAVEGPIQQVIAHQLGTLKLQSKVMDDATVERSTATTLKETFENFEVKKHGAVKLQSGSWIPANPGKIGEIKSGWYDANDNWTKGQ